jgi:hypothetical protein
MVLSVLKKNTSKTEEQKFKYDNIFIDLKEVLPKGFTSFFIKLIMEKLFLLKPGFTKADDPTEYFCPDCAIIEGVLQYYPQIKHSTDIVYIDYQRPRLVLIELIGQEHQSSPVLITDKEPSAEVKYLFKTFGALFFLDTPDSIMEYFSKKYMVGFSAKPYDQTEVCSIG